jgi:hypothetical protein
LHVPFAHTPAQGCPHLPQWAGDVLTSVSQPSLRVLLQSPNPSVHEIPQTPTRHRCTAFARGAPARQLFVHEPQRSTFVSLFVSQPFASFPSQSSNGVSQMAIAHLPSLHLARALGKLQGSQVEVDRHPNAGSSGLTHRLRHAFWPSGHDLPSSRSSKEGMQAAMVRVTVRAAGRTRITVGAKFPGFRAADAATLLSQ